jgi:hypothetical protein
LTAAGPERLGALLRAHWQVEGPYRVRDVTFGKDASRVRTASGPQVMACLRNLAVGLLGLAGHAGTAQRCDGSPATLPVRWPSSASHERTQRPKPDQAKA